MFTFITPINRLHTIDEQIEWITRVLKQGEHPAAGLTLNLNVGPVDEARGFAMENIQIAWPTQELLELLLKGLKDSRQHTLSYLVRDFNTVYDFLEKEKGYKMTPEGMIKEGLTDGPKV